MLPAGKTASRCIKAPRSPIESDSAAAPAAASVGWRLPEETRRARRLPPAFFPAARKTARCTERSAPFFRLKWRRRKHVQARSKEKSAPSSRRFRRKAPAGNSGWKGKSRRGTDTMPPESEIRQPPALLRRSRPRRQNSPAPRPRRSRPPRGKTAAPPSKQWLPEARWRRFAPPPAKSLRQTRRAHTAPDERAAARAPQQSGARQESGYLRVFSLVPSPHL